MKVKCPKCGRMLDVAGLQPGSVLTCECGNAVAVPKPGTSKRALFVWVGAGLALLSCTCFGILGAIAIPNFMRFQSRAKQSECVINLKTLHMAQATRPDSDYDPVLSKSQFLPERGNRYAYFAGSGPMEDRSGPQATGTEEAHAIGVDTFTHKDQTPVTFNQLPPDVARIAGISGECPDNCSIAIVCAGNIDRDSTLDVWSISTAERQASDGTTIAPGEPFQHVNDLED
ncbi:fimbrial protein [Hyalangium rubrum]|uniref:Fimbrial protein n=1 Tax=Hyalangium rubrum TaxID=3103134 RepID=A0ABU5HC23_9BACT|nr:fimbrial protein [Hyalangium sp. s54d21]MDY7230835.1 fimbrial protein [Hyalangium sp. s54d21]